MREFKFRYWDTFDKKEPKMIYFNFGKVSGGSVYPDINTVMQFIGLQDKNGKDIYEGDIVLLDILNVQNSLRFNDEEKRGIFKRDLKIISFQKGTFGFYPVFPDLNHIDDKEWSPLLHDSDSDLWSDSMKVIGNIYENPELLK